MSIFKKVSFFAFSLFLISIVANAETIQYFERNLTIGSRGADVMRLQQFLNSDPDTIVATSGSGSSGNETEYFGNLTKNAVIKFQVKYGIEPSVGYFGPLSRGKANSILSLRYVTLDTAFGTSTDWDTSSVYTGSSVLGSSSVYNPNYSYTYNSDTATDFFANANTYGTSDGISVDLKVNYQDNNVSSYAGQQVVSWSAGNASYCMSSSVPSIVGWNNNSKTTSGAETINIASSTTIYLKCFDTQSNYAEDSVRVNVVDLFGGNYSLASSTDWSASSSMAGLTVPASSLASSTTASSTASSTDAIAAQATSLDHIQVIAEPQHCGVPAKNFIIPSYSYSDHELTRYVWVMGESELIDNMAGAVVGNILNGDQDGDAEDATFTPPFGIPSTGMALYSVIGPEEDCAVFGDTEKILRGYLTAQGRDWVEEQESSTSSSSGSSGGIF